MNYNFFLYYVLCATVIIKHLTEWPSCQKRLQFFKMQLIMFWNGAHSEKLSQRVCKTMKDLTFVWNVLQLKFKYFPQYLLFHGERFDRHKITNMQIIGSL